MEDVILDSTDMRVARSILEGGFGFGSKEEYLSCISSSNLAD